MTPAIRWATRLLILFVVIVVLAALAGSLSNDELGFFPALAGSAWSLAKVVLVLAAVWLIVYLPPIWGLRRWWAGYRKRHTFHNDQNEKSLSKIIGNGTAMFGVVTISLAVLLATFGYLVAPDATPDANNQISELSLKKPGFKATILQVRYNREAKRTGLFKRIVSGRPSNYDEVPINSWWFGDDSLFAERYIGDDMQGDTLAWDLVDVVRAKSFEDSRVRTEGDLMHYTGIDGQPASASIAEMKAEIERSRVRTRTFLFGTDTPGRDYLSRIIIGVRVSISVGIIAVFIALTIGIAMGSAAGFFRGWIDDVIMWVINVFWSIPTLLLVFPIVFAFGQQFWTIYVAVGLTMWVDIARIVRGQVMSEREKEYVEAAHGFGFSNFRTIVRHILPNISGPVIVITAANFAYAILIEAGLSFLGIGVQPPKPSWGLMISKHKDYIVTGDPHLALIPGFAIVLLVLSFFLIGNGLRDALDAKTKIDH